MFEFSVSKDMKNASQDGTFMFNTNCQGIEN